MGFSFKNIQKNLSKIFCLRIKFWVFFLRRDLTTRVVNSPGNPKNAEIPRGIPGEFPGEFPGIPRTPIFCNSKFTVLKKFKTWIPAK